MDYGFKVTVQGRELLAALLATGGELEITRVAFGSGRVTEDTNLADMTDLVQYVAEGKISERRHKDNVLYLTTQYASNFTPGLGAFYLAEFIVQAKHPVSGENVTLLYATLGDYIQPVNAYSETRAPDIRSYPLAIALSDEIQVSITAPAGLVTAEELYAHDHDPAAHGAGKPGGAASLDEDGKVRAEQLPFRVIATRPRAPGKPDYGLGGGGEETAVIALEAGPLSGTAELSILVSGQEYDGDNLSTDGENAPDGTIIIKKVEE